MKGSSRKGRERQAAILAIAEDLFGGYGYQATSLQSIADRAGISQTGLIHHFPTKEQLFGAVIDARQREDKHAFERLLVEHRGDALEVILAMVRALVARPTRARFYVAVVARGLVSADPAPQQFIDWTRRSCGYLAGQLAARQAEGWLSADVDVGVVSRQIHAVMYGLTLQWRLDPGRVDILSITTAYLEQLRAQIDAPPPRV